MKILSRYVLREHLGPLAFALTALTSLLMLNFIAKRFGDIVGKGLPTSVIVEFFLLALPFTVAMTLPMAVLVAVLYAFSRLAAESEITALKASGVSMGRIMAPVLVAATVLAIGMVLFNDFVLPAANHRLRTLQTDIGRTKPTFALREQIINDIKPGRIFLRANRIDKASSRLYQVVIYDFGDGAKRRTIVSDSGDINMINGTDHLQLKLYNGTMTEIPTASPTQLTRLSYQTNTIVVRDVAQSFSRDSADNYKSEREMGVCEMQAQVAGAERDLYRESRASSIAQQRALKALTRGIVDPLKPYDTLRTPSLGIGRLYCTASGALAALVAPRDTTGKGGTPKSGGAAGGVSAAAPSILSQLAAVAPSSGVNGPQSANGGMPPEALVTPTMASTGIGSTIEQTIQRASIARSTWAQYEVEIHKKFSLAVACIVFVLLGAPLALRFPRGGVGLVIGASLGVFALYYVCLIAGESLGDDGKLPPWVAMWGANIVFTIVGILLFLRMGREGSTARGGDLDDVKERLIGWWSSARGAIGRRVLPLRAAGGR